MGKRVALVLAGCGVFDGSEIHEASAALVHLSRGGAEVAGAAGFRGVYIYLYMCMSVCAAQPALRHTAAGSPPLNGIGPFPACGVPCAAPVPYKASSAIISLFMLPPPLFYSSPPAS